jgi:hypothetical protein
MKRRREKREDEERKDGMMGVSVCWSAYAHWVAVAFHLTMYASVCNLVRRMLRKRASSTHNCSNAVRVGGQLGKKAEEIRR